MRLGSILIERKGVLWHGRRKWSCACLGCSPPTNRPPDLDEAQLSPGYRAERLALDITRYWGNRDAQLTVGRIG